jgi:hypothetical protein
MPGSIFSEITYYLEIYVSADIHGMGHFGMIVVPQSILLCGIQLRYVQRHWSSTVLTYEIFTLNEANTCVAIPNAWQRSVLALS